MLWLASGEGNGTPLQYSCLENPMDGGAWWAAVHGVARSRTRLSDFIFTFQFYALEKEMATHSNVLAWRIPGTGEPGELPSMESHRVGHDWSDLAVTGLCGNQEKDNQTVTDSAEPCKHCSKALLKMPICRKAHMLAVGRISLAQVQRITVSFKVIRTASSFLIKINPNSSHIHFSSLCFQSIKSGF